MCFPLVLKRSSQTKEKSIHQIVCSGPNLKYWRHGLILTKKVLFTRKGHLKFYQPLFKPFFKDFTKKQV